MAARRYVLIRGLFHLLFVSTTRLPTGPGSSELPRIGVCKVIGWSLEEGRAAISIMVVLVVTSTSTMDAVAQSKLGTACGSSDELDRLNTYDVYEFHFRR